MVAQVPLSDALRNARGDGAARRPNGDHRQPPPEEARRRRRVARRSDRVSRVTQEMVVTIETTRRPGEDEKTTVRVFKDRVESRSRSPLNDAR